MKGNGERRVRKPPGGPQVLHLRITLEEIEPPIWRTVAVHSDMTLHELHRVIQVLFQWEDRHLYQFRIGKTNYEEPDEEAEGVSSYETVIRDLGFTRGDTFTYVYDFGDDWHHLLEVREVAPFTEDDWLPVVTGGERAGPPEDCGGPDRFLELTRALADRRHPEHKELREWVGSDYDPERFDRRTVTRYLRLAAAWDVISNGVDYFYE